MSYGSILSFTTTMDRWNRKVSEFLSQYVNQPWFYVGVVLVLFLLGIWAIGYFNKR